MATPSARTRTRPRRPGAGSDATYKWWALSCTSLGMLLATINSGTLIIALPDLERSLHTTPAPARLGHSRLHDRLDRAGADGRTAIRPLRTQARLRRRLRAVRARLARRRLLVRRNRADPVADRPGNRRQPAVRERRRACHRRLPARAARAGDGHEHDGRGRRARARAGARRRTRHDLLALGLLVQRAARSRGQHLGRPGAARAGKAGHQPRPRPARDEHLRRRPHRARARALARRDLRLEQRHHDRVVDRRRRAASTVRADRAPRPSADARPDDLPQPACSRRRRAPRS